MEYLPADVLAIDDPTKITILELKRILTNFDVELNPNKQQKKYFLEQFYALQQRLKTKPSNSPLVAPPQTASPDVFTATPRSRQRSPRRVKPRLDFSATLTPHNEFQQEDVEFESIIQDDTVEHVQASRSSRSRSPRRAKPAIASPVENDSPVQARSPVQESEPKRARKTIPVWHLSALFAIFALALFIRMNKCDLLHGKCDLLQWSNNGTDAATSEQTSTQRSFDRLITLPRRTFEAVLVLPVQIIQNVFLVSTELAQQIALPAIMLSLSALLMILSFKRSNAKRERQREISRLKEKILEVLRKQLKNNLEHPNVFPKFVVDAALRDELNVSDVAVWEEAVDGVRNRIAKKVEMVAGSQETVLEYTGPAFGLE
jgi:hypothetical protein